MKKLPKVWKTQHGHKIKIIFMDKEHIENCIKFLQRFIERANAENSVTAMFNAWWIDKDDYHPPAEYHSTQFAEEYIKAFKQELKNREDKENHEKQYQDQWNSRS